MKNKPTWVYGRDPAPNTWHETADIIRSLSKPVKKRKKSELIARLDELEKMIKDRGQ